MSKSKIFMGLGSLVLATSAFLAAKPAKKARAIATGYAKVNYPLIAVTNLTTFSNGKTAFFATSGGVLETLRTNPAGGGAILYYR